MNTAPSWLPPLPSPCCSGNTGFGSPPFTRYVVGSRVGWSECHSPPKAPYSVGLQAGMANRGTNIKDSPCHTQGRHY